MSVKGTWIRKKTVTDDEWAESHARIFGKRPVKEENDESGTDAGITGCPAPCPTEE